MTKDELKNHAFIAIAEIDVHKGAAKWVDTAKRYGKTIPTSFQPESADYYNAWWWIQDMESCEYTAGFIWELIPYTPRALAEFAGRNAKYCKG